MFTQKFLISALVLAAASIPASASSCTSTLCTGSVASGSDSADRTTFNTGNSDLSFSNITFDNATGTYTTATGLDASSAPSASLFGTSFIGCLSSQSPCASNAVGVAVGDLTVPGIWDGGTDPALEVNTNAYGGGSFDTITIMLPANTYAFGVDILNQNNFPTGVPLFVHVDNTADKSTAAPVALPGSVFFAFRSATPISKVSIYPGIASEQLAIDNFELGQQGTAATPEAATFLMIGSGLAMLLYARKRRWVRSLGLA
jgi:hypothetical protein